MITLTLDSRIWLLLGELTALTGYMTWLLIDGTVITRAAYAYHGRAILAGARAGITAFRARLARPRRKAGSHRKARSWRITRGGYSFGPGRWSF